MHAKCTPYLQPQLGSHMTKTVRMWLQRGEGFTSVILDPCALWGRCLAGSTVIRYTHLHVVASTSQDSWHMLTCQDGQCKFCWALLCTAQPSTCAEGAEYIYNYIYGIHVFINPIWYVHSCFPRIIFPGTLARVSTWRVKECSAFPVFL